MSEQTTGVRAGTSEDQKERMAAQEADSPSTLIKVMSEFEGM